LVTNFGPNVLYRNRGDGTFENVAAAAGVEAPGWNTGAAFFDADGDGDLDLYIASYIDCTMQDVLEAKPTLEWKGVAKVAVGPFGLKGASDHFFLNDGHGHFTDATEASGMKDLALGFGFTVRAGDLNGDGRPDLYVANDSDANYLYRNEGGGRFRDTGLWSGTAVDVNGSAQAGMGVAFGDVDGDGVVDILVTNFSEDFSTLYRGTGEGFYEDVSAPSGVGPATFLSLSWGALFADLDNDGDEDIVIANGHIYPQIEGHPETGLTFNEKNLLLENDGHGHFTDVTDEAGPGFAEMLSSRGLAAGDFDDDGDVDLLITNVNAPPSLLRNDSPGGAWLTVVLDPAPGKGTIVGARVTVQADGKKMIRDLASSGSYVSAHDPRLHFGLGSAAKADVVQVDWPGGARTTRRDVAARTVLHLKPGD
ncbi:MAG TPA: CRTAC1 family protein, partial [Candidatus Saccharimonadales bacterium]|nr:CRTAC1 family protein [Candidatus Saccharimonadales bacterium]